MFEAILVVCFLGSPLCAKATDPLGPYWKESECEARVIEMIQDVVPMVRAMKPDAEIASIEGACRRLDAA